MDSVELSKRLRDLSKDGSSYKRTICKMAANAPVADPAPLPAAGCEIPKRTIDADELQDLKECLDWDKEEFPKALKEYTGIVAKPYTAFQYYYENGDYIGDSDYCSIEDVLKEAGIEVADDGR